MQFAARGCRLSELCLQAGAPGPSASSGAALQALLICSSGSNGKPQCLSLSPQMGLSRGPPGVDGPACATWGGVSGQRGPR